MAIVTVRNSVQLKWYRHPNISGGWVHDVCGHTMERHGWIDPVYMTDDCGWTAGQDGIVICPDGPRPRITEGGISQ